MASSTITSHQRWASSSRKSGMTVLGKVPKPINLPSQRLENNGLDPNVEIVPKGTMTWGNRPNSSSSSPSPNAWSTNTETSRPVSSSLLSPKPSSPNETGRPVSSGSSPHTRPSTGSTDRVDGLNSNLNLDSNLRPNSSSGVFGVGNNLMMSANRPRSADTRPGSAHLSRFAESSDKMGGKTNGGFNLSSGDFPTLGSEKPSESNRGHSSQGRPTSRDAKPKETLDAPPTGHGLQGRPISSSSTDPRPKTPNTGDYTDPRSQTTQNINILKTEDPSNHWYRDQQLPYQPPNLYHQPLNPNLNNPHIPPPHQFDPSWRAPHEPIWYGPPGPHGPNGPHRPHAPTQHGPGPHGPHGPGSYRAAGVYPVDPYVYYPGPQFRGPPPPTAESASRPHMPAHNAYMIPTHIPARPGVHAPYPPVTYDAGYYGPPRTGFYPTPNHHPHNPPHQNTNHHHYNNNPNNHNNSNNNRNNSQQGILSQYCEKPGSSADFGQKQYKVLLKHREHKEEKKEEVEIVPPAGKSGDTSSETGSEKQLKKKDPLIEKIEGLNSKMHGTSEDTSSEKKKDPLIGKIEGLNSKIRSLDKVKKQESGEGILGNPVKQKELSVQVPVETGTKGGNDGTVSEANLDPLDPAEYEILRLKQKEKAAQRAKELQREEEERIRQQKAKALAKLEELNKRAILQKDPSISATDKQQPLKKDEQEQPQKQEEPLKVDNEAVNLQKEPVIVGNDKQLKLKEPVPDDKHLQKEPRKHFQKEPRKFPNHKQPQQDNFQKETLKFTNEKHPQQEPPKIYHDTNLQKGPSKFSNDANLQKEPSRGEMSVPTTVTLSFGTISEVQIISHEISVPTTGTVQETISVHSQPKHHHNHNKQTSYKKRYNGNNSNNNNSSNTLSETSINEKQNDIGTGTANIVTGTDGQNETTQHKKRGNKNTRNKNKSDFGNPNLVPLEQRVEKSSNEGKEVQNPNSVPSENLSKPNENPNYSPRPNENPNFHNNNRGGGNWKGQSSRRPVRNPNPRSVPDKSHAAETVMWAPVKHSNKTLNQSEESTNNNDNITESGNNNNKGETEKQSNILPSVKTKRAEMERYVPKPQLERKLDEVGTENNTGTNVGTENNTGANDNNNNNNRAFNKRGNGGKPNASWRQRAVVPVEPVQEENNNDHEKRNNYGENDKFYKATGNNYSTGGNNYSGGGDVIIPETGDQTWKPKGHFKGNNNWQKVNNHEEGKTVISNDNRVGSGSTRYQQRGSGRGRNGNFTRE